uniref:uncharacterized protein LOC122779734 n=1 Tax=Solea senegalensis TaxID=28829 RepID=UPI001CD8AD2C|nr:uncharacterized protein LOC122779734 [Solea senegalensis]
MDGRSIRSQRQEEDEEQRGQPYAKISATSGEPGTVALWTETMPWLWNQNVLDQNDPAVWNQTHQICGAGLCQSGKFGSTTAGLFWSSMSGSTTLAKRNPQPCHCGTQPGNPRTVRNPAAAVGPNLATLALCATQHLLWDPTWQPSHCMQPSSHCWTQPGNPHTARNPAAAGNPLMATLTLHATQQPVGPNLATLAKKPSFHPLESDHHYSVHKPAIAHTAKFPHPCPLAQPSRCVTNQPLTQPSRCVTNQPFAQPSRCVTQASHHSHNPTVVVLNLRPHEPNNNRNLG